MLFSGMSMLFYHWWTLIPQICAKRQCAPKYLIHSWYEQIWTKVKHWYTFLWQRKSTRIFFPKHSFIVNLFFSYMKMDHLFIHLDRHGLAFAKYRLFFTATNISKHLQSPTYLPTVFTNKTLNFCYSSKGKICISKCHFHIKISPVFDLISLDLDIKDTIFYIFPLFWKKI